MKASNQSDSITVAAMTYKCSKRVILWLFLLFSFACCLSESFAQSGTSQAIQVPDSTRVTHAELNQELERIEQRQNDVLESVSGAFMRALWIFGVLGTLIAAFSFFQTFNDSRTQKLLKGQIDEGKEITQSYQKNIDSMTALVGSLKDVFELQAKAQQMLRDIEGLQNDKELELQRWEQEIIVLNEYAMDLSLRAKRNSYTQTSFQYSFREFKDKYEIINRSIDTKGKFNANSYYIIGLYHRVENNYDEAIENFEHSIELAESHKQDKSRESELYPALSKYGTNITKWLTKLQNVCLYHSAIILYNRGKYEESRNRFEDALKYDVNDYKAKTYIPEAMFLGRLSSFSKIEETFRQVINEIESLTPERTKNFAESREQLLSQTYMKFANCYMADSTDEEYLRHKDLSVAEKYLRLARNLNPISNIINFSYAQILYLQEQQGLRSDSQSRQTYRQIFSDVFKNLKTQVGRITEAKILMMYYYILGICCSYGKIENEMPQVYLMRVYELNPQLPNYEDLRIFSPLTKNDLTVERFLSEIQKFETNIAAEGKGVLTEKRPEIVIEPMPASESEDVSQEQTQEKEEPALASKEEKVDKYTERVKLF